MGDAPRECCFLKIVAPVAPVAPIVQLLAATTVAEKATPFRADDTLMPAPPSTAPTVQPNAAQLAQAMQQPMVSVAMLTTVAAADPDRERRRRMAEPAEEGIEKLEALHHALASGSVPPEQLQDLQQWLETAPVPQDEAIAAILHDIDLRVRVELAKLDISL